MKSSIYFVVFLMIFSIACNNVEQNRIDKFNQAQKNIISQEVEKPIGKPIGKAAKMDKKSACKTFRNGKFLIVDEDNKGATMQIERSGKTQTEINTLTNEKTVFDVLWINTCVAHLTLKEGNLGMMQFFKDKILVMQIEETNLVEGYYVYSSRIRGDSDKVFYQKAKRVKN